MASVMANIDAEAQLRKVKHPLRICVVTFPSASESIYVLLSDLLKILESLSDRLIVLTGGMPENKLPSKKVQVVDVNTTMPFRQSIHPAWISTLILALKNMSIQIKIARAMLKVSKDIDVAIFFIGIPSLLLPMLIAKIRGNKVVWY